MAGSGWSVADGRSDAHLRAAASQCGRCARTAPAWTESAAAARPCVSALAAAGMTARRVAPRCCAKPPARARQRVSTTEKQKIEEAAGLHIGGRRVPALVHTMSIGWPRVRPWDASSVASTAAHTEAAQDHRLTGQRSLCAHNTQHAEGGCKSYMSISPAAACTWGFRAACCLRAARSPPSLSHSTRPAASALSPPPAPQTSPGIRSMLCIAWCRKQHAGLSGRHPQIVVR